MKILFVASEGLPFSKTGGLADVIEALPKALAAQGHEVAVLLPRYRNIRADCGRRPEPDVPQGERAAFSCNRGWRQPCSGVHYYFVDDPNTSIGISLTVSRGRIIRTTRSALPSFAARPSNSANASGCPT